MDAIRLATPEEVDAIKAEADLGPGCSVMSFGNARAVIRHCTEIDPVLFAELSDPRKMLFMWGLETLLRSHDVPFYYFNIPADDSQYRKVLEHMGAEVVSKAPELRFKKAL